mmetsp:Transcript_6012/g.16353  ORF Transcript_6012/g.16353 Transcript_6012/m.16353 type:complete len:358 (-) Transcript_6012:440-1513(-)
MRDGGIVSDGVEVIICDEQINDSGVLAAHARGGVRELIGGKDVLVEGADIGVEPVLVVDVVRVDAWCGPGVLDLEGDGLAGLLDDLEWELAGPRGLSLLLDELDVVLDWAVALRKRWEWAGVNWVEWVVVELGTLSFLDEVTTDDHASLVSREGVAKVRSWSKEGSRDLSVANGVVTELDVFSVWEVPQDGGSGGWVELDAEIAVGVQESGDVVHEGDAAWLLGCRVEGGDVEDHGLAGKVGVEVYDEAEGFAVEEIRGEVEDLEAFVVSGRESVVSTSFADEHSVAWEAAVVLGLDVELGHEVAVCGEVEVGVMHDGASRADLPASAADDRSLVGDGSGSVRSWEGDDGDEALEGD